MIVRELIARLGIDVDAKKANEAESRLGKIKGMMQTLAGMFAFNQVFGFLSNTVNMASGVEQTLGKLRMNFAESTDGVVKWAKAYSDATGASEYEMREMAATFGSMLVPTLDFDRTKAAEMSQTLSGLAYDLAAINDKDPSETMGQLFSAMTGETEAVERLGISIKEKALQQFADEKGIKTKISAMTVAQKAELIYGKIVRDTQDKVGGAKREAKSYAGQQLKLRASMRDLMTTIGQFLIGPASKLVGWLKDGALFMKKWAESSTNMKAAAIVLTAVMTTLAIAMIAANLPIVAAVAAIGALYLIVQDLVVAFQGGDSAFGRFLDALGGAGTAQFVIEKLTKAWEWFIFLVTSGRTRQAFKDALRLIADSFRNVFNIARRLGTVIGDFLSWREQMQSLSADLEARKITPVEWFARAGELWKRRKAGGEALDREIAHEEALLDLSRGNADKPVPMGPVAPPVTLNVYGDVPNEQLERALRASERARKPWLEIHESTGNTSPKEGI
jgi:hypothetical protein